MARARSIKPGFFHDVELTSLPPLTRLLFAGLWCCADRAGRIVDNPRQIKHDVLPDDRCDIDKMLDSLSAGEDSFIVRYEHGGRRYIQVRKWGKHQNPHVKEPASLIPAPDDPAKSGASTVQAPGENSAGPGNSGASRASSLTPSSLTPDSLNPEPGAPPRFATWQADETYAPLIELYRESGKPVIDEDFTEAWFAWKTLDFEQKLARVDRLRSNIEAGLYSDPNFIPAPRKFIEREWKRELKPAANGGAPRQGIFAKAMAAIPDEWTDDEKRRMR